MGNADHAEAFFDGFIIRTYLRLGRGGARWLVNPFQVDSTPGEGTRVTITRWK